jgi:hypothetical protein
MDLKRFLIWTSFLPQFFDRKIYGTTAGAWIAFVLIAVLTFATLMAIRGVLKRTLGKVAARTSSKLDDLVVALIGHTPGFCAVYSRFVRGFAGAESDPERSSNRGYGGGARDSSPNRAVGEFDHRVRDRACPA